MLDSLVLNNLPSNFESKYLQTLKSAHQADDLTMIENSLNLSQESFVLKTCQRTLILSYGYNPFKMNSSVSKHFTHHQIPHHLEVESKNSLQSPLYSLCPAVNGLVTTLNGKDAYTYLLEIICGLKSKLIGENEIVGQFKTSYKKYLQTNYNSELLQILEKLFKDAKKIRSEHLIGLSQKTYASIARRKIVTELKGDYVVVLGSGQLAEDVINQFKKKINVVICARNKNKVMGLMAEHSVSSIPWERRDELLIDHPYIVNTIGSEEKIFNSDFFDKRIKRLSKHLFIDLGSPSAIESTKAHTCAIMSLEDVFKEGAIKEASKRLKVKKAKEALKSIADRREELFKKKYQRSLLKRIENFSPPLATKKSNLQFV